MSETAVVIETNPLGGSALSRIAQAGEGLAWYAERPRTPDAWHARAGQVRDGAARGWDRALAPAFGNSSGAAADRLARVAAGKGVVVTTGQQPGLFGGPVYTWSKAISALALADAIEEATGVPTAPVFWAATDDGDFGEASYTYLSRPGGADRISIASSMPEGTRMIDVPLPDMTALLEDLARASGSVADERPLRAVEAAYAPGHTVGSSYLALLRAILEPMGISVLDAAHPAVTTTAHPVLVRALLDRERVGRALAERNGELERAGHQVQVADLADLTLVFERREMRRERVARQRAAVVAATVEPGGLSPNVLLRPVVERALLPTAAYVAGPGELAYFAQVSAVAGALGVEAPLAVPRWSGTMIEPEVARILARHGLAVADFADPHAVEGRLARSAWPADLSSAVAALRRDLGERMAGLKAALQAQGGLVPPASVEGTARGMDWRLTRLERRITAAVKRREQALLRELGTARGSLFPGGMRQERALNLIPLLARHGTGLLGAMRDAATVHARGLIDPRAIVAAAGR